MCRATRAECDDELCHEKSTALRDTFLPQVHFPIFPPNLPFLPDMLSIFA